NLPMRLTGFAAIEYAEKEGLRLNKAPDRIDEGREGLTVAEAEAIASEEPDLIWLDVPERDYFGEPKNMEPERGGRAERDREPPNPGEAGVPPWSPASPGLAEVRTAY